MDIAFLALAGFSLFVLRYKKPHLERRVRVPLYPLVPAVFVLISALFVLNALVEKPQQAVAGIAVLGVGLIVYRYFKNKKTNHGKDNI